MIADLKPYAEYKESGVPWLGQVPGHWAPTKLKHAFQRIIGGSTPASENPKYWNGDVTWVTPADVSRSERLCRSIRQISRVGMLSCSTEMVPTGSIVLTSRAPVGNVAIADVDLCTNQGCKALIPNHAVLAPMFGFWLLSIMKAELQSLSTGTTFSEISTTRLGSAFGVLPPPAEQAAIVRFLDLANGRLERAIRAKRKVIALLNEQKQAIIHRAVTRGLDPSVPLKPSGIPWVGDIPSTYKRTRLGRVCHSIRDGTHNPPPAVPGIHRLLSVRNIIGGKFVTRSDDRTMTSTAYLELQRSYNVQAGDIVIALVGATTGKSAVVEAMENVTVQRSLGILRPNLSLVFGDFLNLLLSCLLVQSQIRRIMGKYAAQPGIYLEELGGIHVIFPKLEEQISIVAYVRNAIAPISTAVTRLEREIELLREYRSRLVADVVTGKLDVREAAARLPEEVAPDTTGDEADLSIDPEAADEEAAV